MSLFTDVPTFGPTGESVPGTLADLFVSLGKSTYSIFDQGSGKFQTSAGTGTVNAGDPVGCWVAAYQAGESWKFQQPTSASRPTWSNAVFTHPGIYGNGTSHCLESDSTTALNRPVTVLVLYSWTNTLGMVWSQNGQQFGIRHQAMNTPGSLFEFGASVEAQGFSAGGGDYDLVSASTRRYRVGASAGVARIAAAFNSSEPVRTSRYGNKLFLLSGGASLFFAGSISTVAVVDRLSAVEQSKALALMV